MALNNKFYIIENVVNHLNECYDRVYIVEQVTNRPFFIRVTHLAQIKPNYQKARNGAEYLIKSLASMKNQLQITNKSSKFDVTINNLNSPDDLSDINGSNRSQFGKEQKLNLFTNNIINDTTIDLIEEDINNTILHFSLYEQGDESSEDDLVGEANSRNVGSIV